MPCFDPMSGATELEVENVTLMGRLNRVTDKLCRVLNGLETCHKEIYNTLPDDIKTWNEEHKEFDKKRSKM